MISFNQFLTLIEGKKKQIQRLKSAYMAGREQAEPKIVDIPAGEPNSPEREAAVKELMKKYNGGGAVRWELKKREKKAAEAARNILKQQVNEVTLGAGENYGSKRYQQRLNKAKKEEAAEKEEQRQQNANAARQSFRTKGIPFSDAKGKDHIVNGVKHYDT